MDYEARVWNILETTGVSMLTTRFAGGLRSRPLDARPDRDAGEIYFVTDVRGLKDDEIAASADVCFTVVRDEDKAYLSITARAEVMRVPLLAAKFWKKSDDVWWPDGPDDRRIVGRPGQRRGGALRIRKGPRDRRKAELGERRKVSVDIG